MKIWSAPSNFGYSTLFSDKLRWGSPTPIGKAQILGRDWLRGFNSFLGNPVRFWRFQLNLAALLPIQPLRQHPQWQLLSCQTARIELDMMKMEETSQGDLRVVQDMCKWHRGATSGQICLNLNREAFPGMLGDALTVYGCFTKLGYPKIWWRWSSFSVWIWP
jgi:hypothetical protein